MNRAQNVKSEKDSHGRGDLMMVTVKGIVHVRGVKQSFD